MKFSEFSDKTIFRNETKLKMSYYILFNGIAEDFSEFQEWPSFPVLEKKVPSQKQIFPYTDW